MDYPEAILFDLDGVLLDTEPLIANAWSQTAKEYNYFLSKDNLNELKGKKKKRLPKVLEWINKRKFFKELLLIQKQKHIMNSSKLNLSKELKI